MCSGSFIIIDLVYAYAKLKTVNERIYQGLIFTFQRSTIFEGDYLTEP